MKPAPLKKNSVWGYDFVHDRCANGQNLKCVTVVDEYTRECLAIKVSSNIRWLDVIATLSSMSAHGMPRYFRSDNVPEFISNALVAWSTQDGIEIAFIEPGKPWQNGLNESVNGKLRDEFFDGMVQKSKVSKGCDRGLAHSI